MHADACIGLGVYLMAAARPYRQAWGLGGGLGGGPSHSVLQAWQLYVSRQQEVSLLGSLAEVNFRMLSVSMIAGTQPAGLQVVGAAPEPGIPGVR